MRVRGLMWAVAALALMGLVALAGCGGPAPAVANNGQSSVNGATASVAPQASLAEKLVGQWDAVGGLPYTLFFNSDGTFSRIYTSKVDGKWSLEGNRICMSNPMPSGPDNVYYAEILNGGEALAFADTTFNKHRS